MQYKTSGKNRAVSSENTNILTLNHWNKIESSDIVQL